MARNPDPYELAARFVAGDLSSEVVRPIQSGLQTYLLLGGEVSLERCLHFPNTPNRVRLAQRDAWIRRAASMMKGLSSTAVAMALAAELSRFVSRGRWAQLKHLREPPEGLTKLTVCLFHIARLNDGATLSGKQIHRLIRHDFPEKCPPDVPNIEVLETTPGDRQEEDRC